MVKRKKAVKAKKLTTPVVGKLKGSDLLLSNSRQNRKEKKHPSCTIAVELLEAWKQMTRRGDTGVMAEQLGYSEPVIRNALKYGHVMQGELPELINKYFMDRIASEKAAAQEMLQQKGGENG